MWLPQLLQADCISWLAHLVGNTLHPLLLERALLLAAALLAAEGDSRTDDDAGDTLSAEEEDPAAAVAAELLIQHGFMSALSIILSPAASAAAAAARRACCVQQQDTMHQQQRQQHHQARHAAMGGAAAATTQGAAVGGSGWSSSDADDDDNDDVSNAGDGSSCEDAESPHSWPPSASAAAAAAAGQRPCSGSTAITAGDAAAAHQALPVAVQRRMRWLYLQPAVLLAVVAVLEQLGRDSAAAAAAQREMPQLPELLLQLLVSCNAAGQHDVLEQLLPVLVMFRGGVLEVLCRTGAGAGRSEAGAQPPQHQQQQQQQEHQPAPDRAGVADGQATRTQGTEDDGVLLLWHLANIAAALQDFDADSLDAQDAAWYLLAAGLKATVQQQQLLQRLFSWAPQDDDGGSMVRQDAGANRSLTAGEGRLGSAQVAAICVQLERLCKCISLSRVPETSRGYAAVAVQMLKVALVKLADAAVQQQQLHPDAATCVQRCVSVLQDC